MKEEHSPTTLGGDSVLRSPVSDPPLNNSAGEAVEVVTVSPAIFPGWDDELIAQLTALWAEGKSCGQIAREIGQGCTRNAVIGKAHRLGLKQRPSPILRLPASESGTGGKGCRFPLWPHNAKPTHEYCGRKNWPGTSYCPTHTEIVCQPGTSILAMEAARKRREAERRRNESWRAARMTGGVAL